MFYLLSSVYSSYFFSDFKFDRSNLISYVFRYKHCIHTLFAIFFQLAYFSVKRPNGRALAYTFLEISSKRLGIDHVDTVKLWGCLHTIISTNVVGLKHEAKRQDRKFTWDFYE